MPIRARMAVFVFVASFCAASFAAAPILGTAGPVTARGAPVAGVMASDAPAAAAPQAPMNGLAKSLANGIYMSGNMTFVFSNGNASLTLDRINNDSSTRTSGTLRISLWATTYPPSRGESLTGYKLVTFSTLQPLAPSTYYYNITRSAAYASPPNGTFWIVATLDEYNPSACPSNADGYCLTDTYVSYSQYTFGPTLPSYNYTDLWWNSSESGWGVVIEHHASNIAFIAWYTYDAYGNPKWYVSPNCPLLGDSCYGKLYETSGPAFGPTFNPNLVSAREVGYVSFVFTGYGSATMQYQVGSQTGTKAVTRQPF